MNTLRQIIGNAWDSLQASFNLLWSKVSPILPDLALALIVLAVGLSVAGFISDKIGAIIKKLKIGDLLDRIIFAPIAKLTGIKINTAGVAVVALKWFLIATVIVAALDLANFSAVIDFLNQAVAYLPNIIVAVLIVVIGSLIANLAAGLVSAVTKKDNLTKAAKVAVNALALIAALGHLVIPLANSFNHLIGSVSFSKLQGDALFIGVIVLVLLASRSLINKTVESLLKR